MHMFRNPSRKLRPALIAAAGLAAALSLAAAGAASGSTMSKTEQMLAAAGFQAIPANTPERQMELTKLKARQLVAQPHGDGFTYVYADPKGCACLYMGDAADYQAYQQAAQQRKIAQQYADASQLGAMNWNAWGPYGDWGWDGPLFIHNGGFGGGHAHGGGGHRGGR
jgi:hypothetical protein